MLESVKYLQALESMIHMSKQVHDAPSTLITASYKLPPLYLQIAFYCNGDCQKEHFPVHKALCKGGIDGYMEVQQGHLKRVSQLTITPPDGGDPLPLIAKE